MRDLPGRGVSVCLHPAHMCDSLTREIAFGFYYYRHKKGSKYTMQYIPLIVFQSFDKLLVCAYF